MNQLIAVRLWLMGNVFSFVRQRMIKILYFHCFSQRNGIFNIHTSMRIYIVSPKKNKRLHTLHLISFVIFWTLSDFIFLFNFRFDWSRVNRRKNVIKDIKMRYCFIRSWIGVVTISCYNYFFLNFHHIFYD